MSHFLWFTVYRRKYAGTLQLLLYVLFIISHLLIIHQIHIYTVVRFSASGL